MQPAAKKCLWWAGASVVGAVALQFFATYVPWLWNGGFDTYYLPGWYSVVGSLASILGNVLFPLAAVLIGAAILINVLVPRIDARRDASDVTTVPDETVHLTATDRRDAVGIADTSVYEPPRP